MSVFSELINDSGFDPAAPHGVDMSPPEPWNPRDAQAMARHIAEQSGISMTNFTKKLSWELNSILALEAAPTPPVAELELHVEAPPIKPLSDLDWDNVADLIDEAWVDEAEVIAETVSSSPPSALTDPTIIGRENWPNSFFEGQPDTGAQPVVEEFQPVEVMLNLDTSVARVIRGHKRTRSKKPTSE
jgi:hypothetical protein